MGSPDHCILTCNLFDVVAVILLKYIRFSWGLLKVELGWAYIYPLGMAMAIGYTVTGIEYKI